MTSDAFRDAICAAGLTPPAVIEAGRFHRFPGVGKRNGNTAGWCKLFADERGGIFGDFSTGLVESWRAERSRQQTPDEREDFRQYVDQAKAEAEAARREDQAQAARKAATIWDAATPATDAHPYLTRKGVKAHGLRLHNGLLVVPMRDSAGELHSLQFIRANGTKRYLTDGRVSACYFSIGNPGNRVCIAEGYATAASIYEATGYAAAVAFDCGNLRAVAEAIQAKYPAATLILCADDDYRTQGNPGVTKATEAARAVGGLVAIPDFGAERPDDATDFNDLAKHRGADAVKRSVASARAPDEESPQPDAPGAAAGQEWPEPQALTAKVQPEPYPTDALPETIRAAVEEVQAFVKAPIPLVASSALSALSVTVQPHVDVLRADKLRGPVSLDLLNIANSGERKTTSDGFFTSSLREYEEQQREAAGPKIKKYLADKAAWDAERDGLLMAIKAASKSASNKDSKPIDVLRLKLEELQKREPEAPRVPTLLLGDDTPENLAWRLAKQWPASGVVSSEAGVILGAHAMNSESIMRNLSLLNVLWDGGTLPIGRRTSESFTVRGARLTMGLQVQEATLRAFIEKAGKLARGSGFLARFLVAWPESTQGFRPFTEAPPSWPHLAAFHKRIAALLAKPMPISEDGTLTPAMLTLAPDAKTAWIAFHDAIEGELRNGGELYEVRDVAAKTADNAARLAALFQVFEHGIGGAVGLEVFEGASRIAAWHLNEARRFFGELALPVELADAARLDSWLLDYCRRERKHAVGKNYVRQYGPLREGGRLDAAIRELADLDRVRLSKEGRQRTIRVNPALIGLAL